MDRMAYKNGKRNFFSKITREEAVADIQRAREETEAEIESELALLRKEDEALSKERQDLINRGLEFCGLDEADYAFFRSLKVGETVEFNRTVPEDDDNLRKLAIAFDRKLEKSNQKESSSVMAQVKDEFSTKVNNKMRKLKRFRPKSEVKFDKFKHKVGGTTDETTEHDDVKVDKIKSEFELNKWKKHRVYLDVQFEEFKKLFDQCNEQDFTFLKDVYNWNDFHKPLTSFVFRKYAGTIIYIPSGGGKSTLYNKYKNIFFDIDLLLWYGDHYLEFSFLFNMAKQSGNWKLLNGFWQRLLFKYKDLINGRILLAHHPDQIPPKMRKICDELILIPRDAGGLREFDENAKSLNMVEDCARVFCNRNQLFYLAVKFNAFKNRHKRILNVNKTKVVTSNQLNDSSIKDNNSTSDSISSIEDEQINLDEQDIEEIEHESIEWDDPRLNVLSRSELAKIDSRFNNIYYDPRFE